MSRQVHSLDQLLEYVGLTGDALGVSPEAAKAFPLRLPQSLLERIEPGNPNDPILRQILPHADEMLAASGFGTDPVGESAFSPVPGLLQKYPGRALLIATGACAINCRYCFRRHFPYDQQEPSLQQAFDWLAAHDDIEEVLISGGDPLTLSLRRLTHIHQKLAAIPHISRLRIHSRQPIVSPDCLTPELVELLAHHRFETVLVVHANHAAELTDEVAAKLWPLRRAGITLLNQSVLLKGVNDDADTLMQLSRRLFSCGILPYYLHQLDRVAGAAHFAVDDARAIELQQQLRDRLSGYLVPKLVVELAGHHSKTPLVAARDQ